MATNKEKKSNLLLQSRRFTLNALGDTQEAFTRVLDLNASEIYSQQNLIPTSSLPFSGSSQHEETSGVIKYWYRHKLTKGNDGTNEAWFFLDPTGSADGVTPQLINSDQKTDFISPKYSEAALANANAEDATPGYNIRVFVSTNSSEPSAGDVRPITDYTYNYKYGVLNFENDAPTNSEYVYITTYQYVGRTVADDTLLGYSGSFSGSFQGDGSQLTGLPLSTFNNLIFSGSVTASVDVSSDIFLIKSASVDMFKVNNEGVTILKTNNTTPSAVAGGIFYSGSGDFFFGS